MAKANRKFRMRDDREAIVGVGTLIVFVATILVAAIASGVIIKTAYTLKDQAERTGLAAKQEITGGLKVIDIVGDTTPGFGGACTAPVGAACIRTVKFTVTTWAGSDGINFKTMKIHYTGVYANEYLTFPNGAGNTQTGNTAGACPCYYASDTVDTSVTAGWNPAGGSYYVGDDLIMYIMIDVRSKAAPNSGVGDRGLAPGSTVTVDFIPAHGPPVEEQFTTPNDYGTSQFIDLTNT